MNCKQCQEKILESFAAGGHMIDPEFSGHRDACSKCSEFFVKQQNFFQSLEAELHSIANSPVPTSFLPGLRVRLDAPTPMVFPRWGLALAAGGALLVLIISSTSHRFVDHPGSPNLTSIASPPTLPLASPLPATEKTMTAFPGVKCKSVGRSKLQVTPSDVIVRPEERRAFFQLVAELPVNRNVAFALANPAPAEPDDSVEISLLQTENVEVKSLDTKLRE